MDLEKNIKKLAENCCCGSKPKPSNVDGDKKEK